MRLGIVLMLMFAMLAGCADDVQVQDEDQYDDLDLQATDDTGIIRGVVVDAAIVPIPDVEITVLGQDMTTTTNADGAFGFDGLPAGFYNLEAQRPGYTATRQQVSVVAGDDAPPVVRLLMEADPTSLPTVVPLTWDGYIACGLSVIAACGLPVVNQQVGDEFVTVLPVDRANLTYLQSEMVWETTTGASPNLQLWQEAYNRVDDKRECSFEAQNAPSPNVINTTFGDFNSHGNRECFETYGSESDLQLRVFSGSIDGTFPPTANGCYPAIPMVGSLCTGVGWAIQQDFTVYNHLFYGFKPPEGWQFSVDGDAAVPTA